MPPTLRKLHALDLEIQRQPTDATCGPTCLHAVYRYLGEEVELDEIIADIPQQESGGTMAVNLANHALRRGYGALIYTYNLHMFDPSWFEGDTPCLAERLRAQAAAKADPRLDAITGSYLDYLRLGGELTMEDLTAGLVRRWLERDRPVLTGISSTFLYRSPREIGTEVLEDDDIRGSPTGHFVVLSGWNPEQRMVRVADPLEDNPRFEERIYWLPIERVINAILLGVLTYDANLLVLEPPERK
jgi:hypothetical protein